jgi:hypothetical protein
MPSTVCDARLTDVLVIWIWEGFVVRLGVMLTQSSPESDRGMGSGLML